MKTNNVRSMGALHPVLFFAVMYVVVLFFSIYICSSIFYSINGSSSADESFAKTTSPVEKQQSFPVQVSTAVVIR